MSSQDEKEILKEALQEWMDGKFASFGRWSFYTLATLAFGAVIYFILITNGWKAP